MPPFPFSLRHPNDPGRSKGREAVHEGGGVVGFCGLAVLVSGYDALAEGLEASHRSLDPASDMSAAISDAAIAAFRARPERIVPDTPGMKISGLRSPTR